MATIGPVSITAEWTKIYEGRVSGAFVGAIQALDNGEVYVRVSDGVGSPTNQGGFMLGNQIIPFAVAATQTVWARAADGNGKIVMG